MEFLSAIGTAIVGKIAEYTVGPVVRQISYVTGCKGNLQQLQAAVEKLKAARDSVANEVGEADKRGEIIQPDVQLWLKKVDDITAKTDQFFQDESPAELKCFHGGFCGNLKFRHQISRKSTKLLPEVVELDGNRGFSGVSCGIRRQEVCSVSTGDYQAFESRTSIVKKIMDELKNPNSKRIGVYGIGGVGKTTLVKQVYKQATVDEKNLFDDVVILLDVKENPNPEGIQKKIVEKLGMKISESENETIDGRANRLCGRIKDKKTLVILDDVWEEIKLEAVGIPSVATCKILLTSRSRTTLSDMRTDKHFALDILEDEETWVLFESKAGDVVKDSSIRTVATQVAKYCKGLPVLIVTVASTLKRRTSLPPWEDALRCLKGSDSQKLTEKTYLGLEWSYRQLNHEELQQFFLLCGITIRGNDIMLTDLLRYAMGLGFLGQVSTIKEARNKMHSLVEELKDFCLLIEDENSKYVRMHDLVRDVANRVALRNHILSSVVDGGGRELKEWSDKDFLEKCTIISLPCGNNILRLPTVLQCQALRMLLLQGDRDDDSLTILPTFFKEMKQLNVLALENMCIPSLPSSFQSLKNVQTLCLESCDLGDITMVGELSNLEILSFSYSDFEQLPKEIAQLTHLRLLDLTYCSGLQVISPGVISSLTRIEDLRMNSFGNWEAEGEGSNASLLELKHLSWLTSLEINIPDANILPANLFSCELERYQIVIGRGSWSIGFAYDGTLNTLEIGESIQLDKGLEMLLRKSHQLYLAGTFGANNILDHQLDTEDFKQLKHLLLQNSFVFTYFIDRKVEFPSLTTLAVDECHGLRFLFSSSMARSLVELKTLIVRSCENMEEIVLSTRGEDGEENMDNLFPKLQSLGLKFLPKLARFCRSSYIEFPSLEELEINNCDDLESFICDPLNSGEKDQEQETALQYSLFDGKVGCRSLERLEINGARKLTTIWQNQSVAHQDYFCRLRDVYVSYCMSLINIFAPSIMGRLNALETIKIDQCKSLEVVFEVIRGSIDDVKAETAHVDTSSSKPFYCRNLDSVEISFCNSLQNIFPVAVARGLEQLHKLKVSRCDKLEGIIGEEAEGVIENPPHELVFPNISSLELNRLPQLKSFYTAGKHTSKWPSLKVVFPSLTTLRVDECHGLRFLFSSTMARSLVELKTLTVRSCKNMEEIVLSTRGEDGEENMDNLFPKLQSLRLEFLPKLARFCRSSYIEFPSLEELEINNCDDLESFICDPLNSGEKDREQETALQYSLFDGKVGCRSLERLEINGARKLKTIWPNQSVAHQDYFCKLRDVHVSYCRSLINIFAPSIMGRLNALETIKIDQCKSLEVVFEVIRGSIDDVKAETAHVDTSSSKPFYCRNLDSVEISFCNSLQNIFPVAVARGLEQLHKLKVRRCDKLEGIIGEEAEGVIENPPLDHELLFPNVSSLEFEHLPQLKSFYSAGMHTSKWPSLKQLNLFDTVRCKVLASEISFFREKHDQMELETTDRPLFLIQKDSFPQLEELTLGPLGKLKSPAEIWYGDGPSPADFFPKLKSVCFNFWAPFSKQAALLFLDKLQNLERIQVAMDHSNKIFVGEIYALPRVRFLTLRSMDSLLHLGNSPSASAAAASPSPVPNLQFLELDNCWSLKSLDQSSAIPFRNLTTLKVAGCHKLKYLISYSVAKSLVQLKTLQVENCWKIEVIIAADGNDDAAGNHEIVIFNCTWQHVKLSDLPRLKGFSLGNCVVKFSSLETFESSIDLKIDTT